MPKLLICIVIFCSVILAGGASFAGTEYPATFQSGRFIISTMAQFDARVAEIHPTLQVTKTPLEEVVWKEQSYPGLLLHAEGVKSGTKIILKMTYVELLPGLWRAVFVDNNICRQSTILENGESVTKWFCEEDAFPIGGFDDLFIVANENVDLDVIQAAFKDPIKPYESVQEKAPEGSLMSLADLEKALEHLGSSMTTEMSQYRPLSPADAEPVPALKIQVQGDLGDGKTLDQTFLYLIDTEGEKLKMKEIDGVICFFSLSLSKEICDKVYVPTPVSNLPLELLNHWTLTDSQTTVPTVGEPKTIPLERQCGDLQNHFATILKVHFERSLFDVSSPSEFQRFIDQFPSTADPMGLLLSAQQKQTLLQEFVSQPGYDEKLHNLIEQFKSGAQGDCQLLSQFLGILKSQLLQKSSEVFQVLAKVKNTNYNLAGFSDGTLSAYQKKILNRVENLQHPVLKNLNPKAATDVALQKIKTYIEKALNRVSELEYFTVSAMAKQDAYSTLFEVEGELAGALLGHQEKKYFGLSVETGFSGRHFVSRLHEAASGQGLQMADEIIEINGQRADQMAYDQIDTILLDTSKSIDFVIKRNGELRELVLSPTALDPMRFYYSVFIDSVKGKKLLTIQMSSFESGIARAIVDEVQRQLQVHSVDAFVLDLRNNPGGNTDEAVNVLSFFAKDRIVTLSKLGARHFSPLKVYPAKSEFFIDDEKPLIVKVNGQTMSSSEIVASGYQALGRSVTVGEPTFGKLVGQFYIPTVLQSKANFGLLITAFEFFNVKGRALNGIGVIPEVLTGEGAVGSFDDGIGLGKDVEVDKLPEVPRYQFTTENLKDLGLDF